MAKNPCIEAHASEDVKARYYKLVEEGMPPMEARRKAAMEEFSKLHKDLEKFKKLVNPKYVPKKYIEPDNTAKVKEITDTYAGKIKEVELSLKEKTNATTKDTEQAKEESITVIKPNKNKQGTGEGEAAKTTKPKTQEPIVEEGGGNVPPVVKDKGVKLDESGMNDKAILNRLLGSKYLSEKQKEQLSKQQLKYKPQSNDEAQAVAKGIVAEMGADNAVLLAEAGKFDGGVNTWVFGEALNEAANLEAAAKTEQGKIEAASKWVEYSTRMDEFERKAGRDISAIYDFYKKSPLGVVLKENKNREGIFNDWYKGKEVDYKELFDALKSSEEGKALLTEEYDTMRKDERKTERQAKRKNIEDFFDKAKFKDDALYSTIIPPKLINGALELMKQTFLAGETVVNSVSVAIEEISKTIKDWDKEKFRTEWEEKLSKFEKKQKKEPIDKSSEEWQNKKKLEFLERFKKKLAGLPEGKKEELIQKSIQKLIENKALEYDEFKKIIAEVLGIGELSPEQAKLMQELAKKINIVQDVAENIRTNKRTEAGLAEFEKAVLDAQEAKHQLDNMVYVQAQPLTRMMDLIKLNTLSMVSLIKNISYNITAQPLFFTKSLFRTGMDYSIFELSKLANKVYGSKIITPEANVFLGQKGYFKGAKEGLSKSMYQVKTGLTDKDYFSKEVRLSQIRPRYAWKDIWAWRKGEKMLTNKQVADKIIQGTGGINAEVIARLLNVGDKWQKFGTETAQATQIAKLEFQLKNDIDQKFFIKFPKEEAYKYYKKKGLGDEEAMAKAEDIESRITKAGDRSVTQQDSWLNDKIAQFSTALSKKADDDVMYKTGDALLKVLKGLNMPFVKIPLNVAWNVINFVNPEVAVLQSAFYGKAAFEAKKAGDFIKYKENVRQSKDWLAHAATGLAMLTATSYLASVGAIKPRNDFEEDKMKETKGEGTYGRQNSLNISLLGRLSTGGDIKEQDDDIWVDLSWFGIVGSMMNIQAKRVEEAKQAKEPEDDTYLNDLMSRMTSATAEGLDNGVFSGTNSLLNAYKSGGGFVDSWMINMANLGTNFFEPATYAQFSKAALDNKSTYKADSYWQELVNNQKQRDIVFRNLVKLAGGNKNPPSDITIWGDEAKNRNDAKGVIFNMLGVEQSDPSKFGMIIYNDYQRTKNSEFFPSYIMDKLNVNGKDVKLNVAEARELRTIIGKERKNMVEPFIMGAATFGDKTYDKLSDDKKVLALKSIYERAKAIGLEKFKQLHPQYEKAENLTEEINKSMDNMSKDLLLMNVDKSFVPQDQTGEETETP